MNGRHRRPAAVAAVEHVDDDGSLVVFLTWLPDGPTARLDGPAAVIWVEAVDTRASGPLDLRVRGRVQSAPEQLVPEIDAFLASLVAHGLLEPLPVEPHPRVAGEGPSC